MRSASVPRVTRPVAQVLSMWPFRSALLLGHWQRMSLTVQALGARRNARLPLVALALLVPAGNTAGAQALERTSTTTALPTAFWADLGDPALADLIGEALDANPDIRAAEARVSGARAARVEAALDLAPSVTASGGYARQRLSNITVPGATGALPDQDVWDAGVHLSWELDLFGEGRRTFQGRYHLTTAARESLRDRQIRLAAAVASAYFELRGAQERLTVARRNAENQRGTLAVTLDRLEGGRGTALDTDRAQAQLSATLAEIPVIEATIAAARHRVGVLLGQPPASAVEALDGEAAAPKLPPVGDVPSPETLLSQRPDVSAADRELAAQVAFASAARARYLPRVSIDGAAGYTGRAFDSLGTAGTPRYAIGPVVSWPLFDLGRVKAGVDGAQAAVAEAEARYQLAVLTAVEEMRVSIISYRAARERLQHLDDAAAASERATELARLRFEEGATGFLEVLDAERTQLERQDRLAVGRSEAAAALVTVYRAFGGEWPREP